MDAGVSRFDGEVNITAGGINHDAGNIGLFASAPVGQQVGGVALVNNVTVGGTTNQVDDFAVTVGVDTVNAASQPDVNARLTSIRNDIYQLARKVRLYGEALRTYGWLQNADV